MNDDKKRHEYAADLRDVAAALHRMADLLDGPGAPVLRSSREGYWFPTKVGLADGRTFFFYVQDDGGITISEAAPTGRVEGE
jgi:hypothetical protein